MHQSSNSTLNDLIETLRDGQQGYRAAAEDVESAELKTLFTELSVERSSFASKLQALVVGLGASKRETAGSVAGALHRGWMNLKASLSTGDAHAILGECERGEASALALYDVALEDKDLSVILRETVELQREDIKAARLSLCGLRADLEPK
jgi:uncharacterized protein (TIGR02284 family)